MSVTYAPESESIMARLAKIEGWTHPALVDLTHLDGTYSAVWRARNGRVHVDEVDTWTTALDKIEKGEVQPPTKPVARKINRPYNLAQRVAQAIELINLDYVEAAKITLEG